MWPCTRPASGTQRPLRTGIMSSTSAMGVPNRHATSRMARVLTTVLRAVYRSPDVNDLFEIDSRRRAVWVQ